MCEREKAGFRCIIFFERALLGDVGFVNTNSLIVLLHCYHGQKRRDGSIY